MPNQRFDVLGLGNAIVDVIAPVDDDFLAKAQLRKGAMQLVDEAQALALYDAMGATMIVSGGSAANTIAGLASFGAKGAFVGKVRADEAGNAFTFIGGHSCHKDERLDVRIAHRGIGNNRSTIRVAHGDDRTRNTLKDSRSVFGIAMEAT